MHLGTPRPFFYFYGFSRKNLGVYWTCYILRFFCQAVMSSISAFKKGLRWAQRRPLRPYSVHHFIPDIHVWESFLPITNFILMSEIYCVFLLFLQQQQTSLIALHNRVHKLIKIQDTGTRKKISSQKKSLLVRNLFETNLLYQKNSSWKKYLLETNILKWNCLERNNLLETNILERNCL